MHSLFIFYQVENECGEIPMLIVQNKIDLMDEAVVTSLVKHVQLLLFAYTKLSINFSSDEVENLSRNLGCRLIRTSVKEDVNVSSIFRYLATKCHQQMMNEYNDLAPIGQPTISELQTNICYLITRFYSA